MEELPGPDISYLDERDYEACAVLPDLTSGTLVYQDSDDMLLEAAPKPMQQYLSSSEICLILRTTSKSSSKLFLSRPTGSFLEAKGRPAASSPFL